MDKVKKFEIPTLGLRNNDFMYCEVALSTEEVSLKMQNVTKIENHKVCYINVTKYKKYKVSYIHVIKPKITTVPDHPDLGRFQ